MSTTSSTTTCTTSTTTTSTYSTSTTTTTTTSTSATSSTTTTTGPFGIFDIVPDDLSAGVAVGDPLTAQFNRSLDPVTVGTNTFVVALKAYRDHNNQVVESRELIEGIVTLATIYRPDDTMVFTPCAPLIPQADYEVVIDDSIGSTIGETLDTIYGWEFQTGIVEEAPDEPSEPELEPPLKDHYPRELDGLAVVSTYPGQYSAQVPLDLAPNAGAITIQWNKDIASVGASNIAWDALNGDYNLVDPVVNATHTLDIVGELIEIRLAPTVSFVENSLVRVTLQDIRGVDDSLDREFVLFFAPVVNPYYVTIPVIRALVGPFIDRVPDTTIAMLILEASLEAQALTPSSIISPALYALALRKWVQCRVGYDLLFPTMVESVGKAKRLAEMQVEWQGISPREKILFYDKFKDCIEKWEEFLRTGGAGITPIATIKGLYDPDRPEVGRGWTRRPSAGPAANTVVPKVVGRRGVKAMRDIRTYRYGNRTGVYRRTWHE